MTISRTLPCLDVRWIAQTFAFRREITRPEPLKSKWLLPGQTYGSVLRDPSGQWRMWYLNDPIYSEYYATSTDGLSWETPDLGLGLSSAQGPVQSNLIMTSPQRDAQGRSLSNIQGPEGFCVLDAQLTPHPAAKARFTAMYLAWVSKGDVDGDPNNSSSGLCFAHSEDGINWTAGENNPVIPGWLDTSNVFFYDQKIKRYVIYGRPNAHVNALTHANRLVARCESEDLVNWSPYQTILDTDDLDADPLRFIDEAALRAGRDVTAAEQAAAWQGVTEGATQLEKPLIRGRNRQWYGLTVFPQGDLYIGLGMMYDVPSGRMWIEVLHSYDGIDWRREADRRPWLGGDASRWDYPMITLAGSPPVRVGDEDWVYYSATAMTHHGVKTSKDPSQPVRAIGACKVGKNRWAGYVAGDREAELVTQVIPKASRISVNAAVQEAGSIRVEVCDRYAKPIEGYELANATPVTGDGLSLPLSWGDVQSLPASDELRLRIVANNATLFAVNLIS